MRGFIIFAVVIVINSAVKKYYPDWALIVAVCGGLLAIWIGTFVFRHKDIPLGWMFYVVIILLSFLSARYVMMFSPIFA